MTDTPTTQDQNSPRPHPLRDAVASELHARPSSPLSPPITLLRLSVVSDEIGAVRDREFVDDLCHRFNVAPPTADASWHAAQMGDVHFRWERHTEMSTFTLFWPGKADGDLFQSRRPPGWPANWLEGAPGSLLGGVHMEIRGGKHPNRQTLADLFGEEVAVAKPSGHACFAATDFKFDADGFSRIGVWSEDMPPADLGRQIQKLLEIETYRMAALLSFPTASDARKEMADVESAVSDVMSRLVAADVDTSDDALLSEVSALSAKTESMAARTSYRFAAGRAYHRLVLERLETLAPDSDEAAAPLGAQSYNAFLTRRLEPAMRTCDAVEQRQLALLDRIARATRLLATRVDVKMGEQNAELLTSMNKRTQTQLRLQQTVEGLSVFAISYYAVGLVSYISKAVKEMGVPINPYILTGVSAPIIMGLLWLGLRRFHKSLHAENPSH